MGEKKGGSVVTENPKGGIAENFGRIQRREPLKFAWKMKTYGGGGGGAPKATKIIKGGFFSEVTLKGGIG